MGPEQVTHLLEIQPIKCTVLKARKRKRDASPGESPQHFCYSDLYLRALKCFLVGEVYVASHLGTKHFLILK